MPKISKTGKEMPASPIRKLVPYAEQAKKNGVKVYHLNIGQPDIETPQIGLDVLKKYNGKVVEYCHSAGLESYRRALSKYYDSIGIDINYNQIMVTFGGSEGLIYTLMSCFDEGDEMIVPEPFYTNYNSFACMAGVKIVPIKSTFESGFALPPISEFEKKITPKTKGILISNPNNPTGYLYSMQELLQIKELALKYDLYVIADEVYRDFCYDGTRHISVMQIAGLENHAILIDSTSKRYSECGIRVGWVATKNQDVLDTIMKFAQARLSPPYFGQLIGMASIDTDPEYFKEVRAEYVKRRNCLINGLNKIPGVHSPMPKGSFYTMAKLPIDDSEIFCRWMLETFRYENQTVMMAPAAGFYATPGLGRDEVRLAYVINTNDLNAALRCLEEGLKEYPGNTLNKI
ncbi:MAG: pyridoxal phosphate-dependent aminotransferase [Bacteroidales bacterium]|nr:pyridoxal phosphate-dependent aminotransferase [Bacteroidales bacterium]MBR6278928.1 pyridoxal phosphate-dependent aminotransferase [Bacteroidales bacterium]